jgi:hypothetical protein
MHPDITRGQRMKAGRNLISVTILGALLSACATDPKQQPPASGPVPQLAAGHGRIYFYRNSSRAPLVQPAVKLNGEVVGTAKPEVAYFVDRKAGQYEIQASTEEKKLNLSLAAGEEKYVRLTVTFGLIGGTVVPELMSKETGQAEMKGLAQVPAAATL